MFGSETVSTCFYDFSLKQQVTEPRYLGKLYDWLSADTVLTPRLKLNNLKSFSAPVRPRSHKKSNLHGGR